MTDTSWCFLEEEEGFLLVEEMGILSPKEEKEGKHLSSGGEKEITDCLEKVEEACEAEELLSGEEDNATCDNCGYAPCKDGQMIENTEQLLVDKCRVAVPNCVSTTWGEGYRAQSGQVDSVDSLHSVTVRWVDGSLSQYNVHKSEHPDTDSVLCFNCIQLDTEKDGIQKIKNDSSHVEQKQEQIVHPRITNSEKKDILKLKNNPDMDELDILENFDLKPILKSTPCDNCGMTPCRDGQMIVNTDELPTQKQCKVTVPNCASNHWGSGPRAQSGQVDSVDSSHTVTVRWVDGSRSQYNVHKSEHPDTDSVLCFNCIKP